MPLAPCPSLRCLGSKESWKKAAKHSACLGTGFIIYPHPTLCASFLSFPTYCVICNQLREAGPLRAAMGQLLLFISPVECKTSSLPSWGTLCGRPPIPYHQASNSSVCSSANHCYLVSQLSHHLSWQAGTQRHYTRPEDEFRSDVLYTRPQLQSDAQDLLHPPLQSLDGQG